MKISIGKCHVSGSALWTGVILLLYAGLATADGLPWESLSSDNYSCRWRQLDLPVERV